MTTTSVILAGGKSARFGTPKGLVPINGKPLIENLIDEIQASGIEKIYLSTDETEIYSKFNIESVPDEFKESGPLAGIHSALKTSEEDSILVLSCDMPNITSVELKRLIEKANQSESGLVYTATPSREHPLCSVFKKTLLPKIQTALENRELSVLDFCHGVENEIVFFHDDEPFLNLNSPDDLKMDEELSPDMEQVVERTIHRFHRGDGIKEVDDKVARESFIRIWLNDNEIAVIHAIKKQIEDLAVGFLYTECIINDISAIQSVEFNEKLDAVTVNTSEEIPKSYSAAVRTVAPGCGAVYFSIRPAFVDYFETVESNAKCSAEKILDLMNSLLKASALFKLTGGVHTSALCDGEKIVHVTDDVGRHNSVDKLLGRELQNPSVPPEKRMILTSGRISTDIIMKAIRGHVPFLVSHSAPSEGAIQLSKKYGITLIGFARGARFNIYTNSERIET
ncbi:MAG: formate dehydrogenase accessory sulfurtransferase FdhD [bacterium]